MDAAEVWRYLSNANVSVVCWEQIRNLLEDFANGTDREQPHKTDVDDCADGIPTSAELFRDMPAIGYIVFGLLILASCLTLANYVEEIHFVTKHFREETRRQKTIWILAFYPTFSMTGLLGVLVPRSGTIVDMTANVFFGTCLYHFGRLMIDYMGGPRRMWELMEDREMSLSTPPCCCCCVCLPKIKFKRKVFFKITLQIMQVAIIRPILMFFAAVLWANGSYQPGNMSLYNGYLYVTFVNLVSTMVAVYGLMLTRGVLRPELEQQFSITGKIASLQLTLICSALPNVIISVLVATGVIRCSPLFPSKARGEMLYHTFLILMMFPFSLMGRAFYRRAQDGQGHAKARSESELKDELTAITDQPEKKLSFIETDHSDYDAEDNPKTTPSSASHIHRPTGHEPHETRTAILDQSNSHA